MNPQVRHIELVFGYRFADPRLVMEALTHPSWIAEQKNADLRDCKRLGVLGSSTLDLIVACELYERFANLRVDKLGVYKTLLIRNTRLAKISRELKIGEQLLIGKSARGKGLGDDVKDNDSVLASAFEAIIGALFIDSRRNLDKIAPGVKKIVFKDFEDIKLQEQWVGDPESHLKMAVQDRLSSSPVYQLTQIDTSGEYAAKVLVRNVILAEAVGKTKAEAQEQAARTALESTRGLKVNLPYALMRTQNLIDQLWAEVK